MTERVSPRRKPIRQSLSVPGDKSISHRAVMFGSLAEGQSEVTGILESGDVRSTRGCFARLGVASEERGGRLLIHGRGLQGLRASSSPLDCGNSGTTMRLLMGILAGQDFSSTLVGDASLSRRPMKRVAAPLEQMGARFTLTEGNYAPLTIAGARLRGIDFALPVASAQIKTAVLLAGLQAQGRTRVSGETESRDHTERLLPHFGVCLSVRGDAIEIEGPQKLLAAPVRVPGDPSSAAFWAAAAALVPGSEIELQGVSLNPTRTGFLDVLGRMGVILETELTVATPEPMGNLRIRAGSGLRATEIAPHEVPRLIDELPLFAVLGAYAQGVSRVTGAQELRVKESDRIAAIVGNLRQCGARIQALADGFEVEGGTLPGGARVESFDDHRIAMAMAIAALAAQAPIEIEGAECAGISYPAFFPTLHALGEKP